jgi:SPOR domain
MTASVRPPPANPVRALPPAAPRVDEGDGLYVVVLSTHKEASAAQEEFAELQKKYAGILGSKQSEVQIISGQTGSWHRLVATPASTKAAASEICNDLRSAGYGRCWVKAY